MNEQKKVEFPIDRFREVASWMSEIERRLTHLESEIKRLDRVTVHDSGRINELKEFAHGLQIVLRPPRKEEQEKSE